MLKLFPCDSSHATCQLCEETDVFNMLFILCQVLRAMTKALDDPKRSVRQEAVRCRQAWYGILNSYDVSVREFIYI